MLLHEDEQRMRMEQWQTAMADATLDKAYDSHAHTANLRFALLSPSLPPPLLACCPLSSAVNSLVMNLLIVEGFQSVAEQFQQEANIKGQHTRAHTHEDELGERGDTD